MLANPKIGHHVDIIGHAGYFIAGMNKQAHVTVHGNVGWSVAVYGDRSELVHARDEVAVVAETDDYVAVASEFRSLAHLPGTAR